MSESDLSSPPRRPSPKNITRLIHDWHLHEATGISLRLKAMRMITSFFSPPDPDRIPQVVDVNDIIERVRNITRITDQRLSRETDASPYELWNSGDTSHLLHAILNAHLDSYLDREPDMHSAEPMMSSWTGACIAVGMYLISILGVWNRGEVPEVRRLFYGLNILDRDLRNRTLDSLPAESRHSRLWFWKAIVGAISIRHAQTHLASAGVLEERAEELSKTLEGFGQAFGEHIRTWAGGHGVCEWVEARNLLYQIAWPKQCPKDGMARSVWERTLSALL